MLKLGFLASHNGGSMRAIVEAIGKGQLNAEARIVISNNESSPALTFARGKGIPARHISATKLGPGADLDAAIADALSEAGADHVIMSGYMRKLGPQTLARFHGKILNIHPGVLPRYGGSGMYGRRVHEAVIQAGERTSGITIHLVDEEYDHGETVASRKVLLVPGDTAESLEARVREQEPEFFVHVLQRLANGELKLPG